MPQEIDPGSSEPLLTLGEIAPFIKQTTGIPFGQSTVEKLCSPAISDGPKPAFYVGKRPLFRPADVVAWARTRLSEEPRPSAHSWPAKVLEQQEDRKVKRRANAEPKSAHEHRR